jgi:8-oxo-dGTP diphosphatase
VVEAAGGIVWRLSAQGVLEVLLVHRPRYDDWSFPKGKLEPEESHPGAALREVEEETGLRCQLVDELAEVRYTDRKGRPKRVRYWSMEAVDGAFTPNDEVDEAVWLPRGEARRRLSYPHDRRVLDSLPVSASAR